MIHTFKLGDVHAALDVHSGSVHLVDEVVFDLLNKTDTKNKYSKTEIDEAKAEIEELQKNGLLDSTSVVTENPVFNPPVVKALCLHVAHDCNLRCKYCFAHTGDYTGERGLMSSEVARRALDYLVTNSLNRRNLEVDFFGGEPLMNFDIVLDAVEYGRMLEKKFEKNIRFTMTTNAYHVTDEMADFINAEMKNLVISIDGRKEVHDAMRPSASGKGSYDRVIANAKKLIAARGDKEYYIRGTFTSKNLDFTEDVRAIADAGFGEISIEPVVCGNELALGEKDLTDIFIEYEKLAMLYIKRKKENHPFHFFHFMVDLDSGPCLNKRLRGCGAGSEYIAVTPKGDVYPCHQFAGEESFYMGNVLNGDIDMKKGEQFSRCHIFSKEKCRSCWAQYYCSGGCFANAYFTNGDISKPHDLSCEMEKKRLEIAIILKVMQAMQND